MGSDFVYPLTPAVQGTKRLRLLQYGGRLPGGCPLGGNRPTKAAAETKALTGGR